MTNINLAQLEGRLSYSFNQPQLLQQALTHRSFSSTHYERLEFLGDAVLGLVISAMLYEKFGSIAEGDLSRVRANLVRQDSLVSIAKRLDLAWFVRLGAGESKTGGAQRPSILADVVEAIIAAVYLDGGFLAAQQLVLHLFADIPLTVETITNSKDAKTRLQELVQRQKKQLPTYTTVEVLGEEHNQLFVVQCSIPDLDQVGVGRGNSRRNAEQQAAQNIFEILEQTNYATK